jgi:hypothetical protein
VCVCARALARACVLGAYAFTAHTPRTCTCGNVDRVREEGADGEKRIEGEPVLEKTLNHEFMQSAFQDRTVPHVVQLT